MEPPTDQDTAAGSNKEQNQHGTTDEQPGSPKPIAADINAAPKRSPFMDVCLAAGVERFYDRGRGMPVNQRRMIELQQELAAHPEIALMSDEACSDVFWREYSALQKTKLQDLKQLCEIVEKSAGAHSEAKVHIEQLKSIILYLSRSRPNVPIQITKKQLLGLYRTQKVVAKYMDIFSKLQKKKAAAAAAAVAAAVAAAATTDGSGVSTAVAESLLRSGSLSGVLHPLQKIPSLKSPILQPTLSQSHTVSGSAASPPSSTSHPSPEQSASTSTPPVLPSATPNTPLSPGTTAQSLHIPPLSLPSSAIPSPSSSLVNSTLTVFSASNPPLSDWELSHRRFGTPSSVGSQPPPRLRPLEPTHVPNRAPATRSPWHDMNMNLARSMNHGQTARPAIPRPGAYGPYPGGTDLDRRSVACGPAELERRSAALKASPFASMMGRYKRVDASNGDDEDDVDEDARACGVPIPIRAVSSIPHPELPMGSPCDSMLDDLLPSDIWPQLSVSPSEAHLGDHVLASLSNPPRGHVPPLLQQLSSSNMPTSPGNLPTPLQMLPSDKCLNLGAGSGDPATGETPREAPAGNPTDESAPLDAKSAGVTGEIPDGRRSAVDTCFAGYPDLHLDDDFNLFHSSSSVGRQFAGCLPPSGDKSACTSTAPPPGDAHAMPPTRRARPDVAQMSARRRSSFEFEFMYGRVAVDPESSMFSGVSPFEAMPDPRLAWEGGLPGVSHPGARQRPPIGKQRMSMRRIRRGPYPAHPRAIPLPAPGHPAWAAYADMETETQSSSPLGQDWQMLGM